MRIYALLGYSLSSFPRALPKPSVSAAHTWTEDLTHQVLPISLASRLNGYMYSIGKSLNVALFILMADH